MYAEELIERVRGLPPSERGQRETLVEEAAVHAGLAQAAAVACGHRHLRLSPAAERDWLDALSERKPVIQAEEPGAGA